MDVNPPTPDVADITTEQLIAAQVVAIRDLNDEIADLETRRKEHKSMLLRMLVEHGENWQDQTGFARLRSAGERPSYNAKKIDNHVLPLLLPLAGQAGKLADLAARGWVAEIILDFSNLEEGDETLARLGVEPGGLVGEEMAISDDGDLRTTIRELTPNQVAEMLRRLTGQLEEVAVNLSTARKVSRVPGGVTVK